VPTSGRFIPFLVFCIDGRSEFSRIGFLSALLNPCTVSVALFEYVSLAVLTASLPRSASLPDDLCHFPHYWMPERESGAISSVYVGSLFCRDFSKYDFDSEVFLEGYRFS